MENKRFRLRVSHMTRQGIGQGLTDRNTRRGDSLARLFDGRILEIHRSALRRISEHTILDFSRRDNHWNSLGDASSRIGVIHDEIDTSWQRNRSRSASHSEFRSWGDSSQILLLDQCFSKLTSISFSPRTSKRLIKLPISQGRSKIIDIILIVGCAQGPAQCRVHRVLVGFVGLDTISSRSTGAILNIIANLVEAQLTISQLLSFVSGERERCGTIHHCAISLCAGCAQGHATQQRRRGGDACEKFPHLHENPLSLCC